MVQGAQQAQALDKAGTMLAEAGLGDVINKYPGEAFRMSRCAEIVRPDQ